MARFMIILTAALLVALPCSLSLAEDVRLEKIVVTPSRTEENYSDVSAKLDVISREDIENSSAGDISELLQQLSSVNISNYGGLGATSNIRMRGSTAAQVLVLVDGRPINTPRDGIAELSNIPLDNVERIEVMHGPGSSLYGSSAMGGTVNIITKDPPKKGQETQAYSSFGTFRTYDERLSHGAKIGNFAYLLSGQYQSSRSFRDNAEFNAKSCNAKLQYAIDDSNDLTFNSGFYKSTVGAPGTITAPDIDDTQDIITKFYDTTWNFKINDYLGASSKFYHNYDRLAFRENSAGSIFDTGFKKDIHTTKVYAIDEQLDLRLSEEYQLICGFNYLDNKNNSTSSAKHRYVVRAVYLDNQFDLNNRLKINLGGRLDDYSNFGSEVNPSASLLYKFDDDNKIHAIISRSFRAPTFNDLYWPDEGWAKGNPDLKPEKGITGEIGIETKINEQISSSLTYYRNDFNQLINWGEASGVWTPVNIGSSVTDGIEFENCLEVFENFDAKLSYTYLRAKNDKTGKYLIYQPKHKIDASLKFKFPEDFALELTGQFTDKRYHDPDNSIKVKNFYLLGANFSKKINTHYTYFISIDNIMDRKYQVIRDYPMQGFTFKSGFKIEF